MCLEPQDLVYSQWVFSPFVMHCGENDHANSGKIPSVKTASWRELWVNMRFRCAAMSSGERTRDEFGSGEYADRRLARRYRTKQFWEECQCLSILFAEA
jgi:hypothetical protein